MMIRKLEYLIALAKEGHFARAAEVCNVSQPTLSTALRHLESEIGVSILKRGTRYNGLTQQGECVLAFAHRMAIQCEQLRRDLANTKGDTFGTLRIGLIASAVPLVSKVMVAFRREHPHVSVRLSELGPTEIRQALSRSELDVAITYWSSELKCEIQHPSVYVEEYVLLVSNTSLLAAKKSVSWSELSRVPLCLLASDLQLPNYPIEKLLERAGSTLAYIETNSVAGLCAQIRSGEWASIVSKTIAEEAGIANGLKYIPLPSADVLPIPVCVLTPATERTSSLANAFCRETVALGTAPQIGKGRLSVVR
jgi:DNA-binding transcriptional LysR family regulator